jgi:hypothetical protein
MKALHYLTIFRSDFKVMVIVLSANGCKGLKGNRALNINKFVLGFQQGKLEIDLYYSLVKTNIWKK